MPPRFSKRERGGFSAVWSGAGFSGFFAGRKGARQEIPIFIFFIDITMWRLMDYWIIELIEILLDFIGIST